MDQSREEIVEEEIWPETEFMVTVARNIEREERQERIARSRRSFWAKEFLLKRMWEKIRERRAMTIWMKKVI